MSYNLTVTISLEDDCVADVEVDFTPGESPSYDGPGSGDEICINSIIVYKLADHSDEQVLTETLLGLGFEDKYYDKICEQCNEARPWEIDPDCEREQD